MKISHNDAVPFPEKSPQNKMPDRFIYRGPSMAPTFQPGQVLHVHTRASSITPGDIIVFNGQNNKDYVVHRVFAVSTEGFITRGDNNLHYDPVPIKLDQVIGKVEKTAYSGRVRTVVGGWRGLWLARILQAVLQIKKLARRALSRPYHWLKRSGIVTRLWRPKIEALYFKTQDGTLVKYVHKGRTVASCWTDTNRWWFKRPYDFVIDPKAKR